MQIETQREPSRPERSPEVFLLSAYTWGDDPEIKRGREVSSDPPGAFPWPEIELWMRGADLTALIVAVNFGGSAPTMAKWISERERSLWVDVLTLRPRTTDRAGWGLAVVRAGDAALRALTRTFGLSPISPIPRTAEETELEATGSETPMGELVVVVLPERVKPATRARLWEELEVFLTDGSDSLSARWQALDGAGLIGLQAAGVREVQRWVNAASRIADEDDPHDRMLQAVLIMAEGRTTYDRAVRNPARFLDTWPENTGEALLSLFGVP